MSRPAALLLAALGLAARAQAHDIPNERVDRAIQVVLAPGRLAIEYEVSLSELTLAQDLRNLAGELPATDRMGLYRAYGEATGPLNARGFLVDVDGREVEPAFRDFALFVEEHPRYVFRLEAPLPEAGRLVVQDTNYVSSEGTSRLALRAAGGLRVDGYDGPADVDAVPIRPDWQLTDEEEWRTRRVEVAFGGPPGSGPIAAPGPVEGAEVGPPPPPATAPARRESNPLTRLLDRPAGASLAGLLLLAFGLGAAHALQPGHGKMLVAAATLGGRRGWARGAALALITTGAHFAVVLAIAAALWWTGATRAEPIHRGLTHLAGFAIAAIGLWRLGRHLAGHGEHDGPSAPVAGRSIVGLGLAGGMVPCWDAVILVLLADLAGRLGLGILLVAGFSLGMAAVLVAVGLAAGRLGAAVVRVDSAGRWERRLGAAGGLALAGIGLYLWLS